MSTGDTAWQVRMLQIDETNAERYLRDGGHIGRHESVHVRRLSGGVSNVVLHITRRGNAGRDFVLKQARERLQVAEPWYCSVQRIWRELDVLRECRSILQERPGSDNESAHSLGIQVPEVLFEDRDNYAFAMTAAPVPHRVWKQDLLAGVTRRRIAAACGRLLGRLHAVTWRNPRIERRLGDRRFFDDLRIDPYYRHLCRADESLERIIQPLIDSTLDRALCLVHGDFSPKNLIIHSEGMMLVDFEVGHYGDPAFDLGFFQSHLLLKAIHAGDQYPDYLELSTTFWQSYEAEVSQRVKGQELQNLCQRSMRHLGGCGLARIDGKSPVEYLSPSHQQQARTLCTRILSDEPTRWTDTKHLAEAFLSSGLSDRSPRP